MFAATSRIRSLLTHEEAYPAAALAEHIFDVLLAHELGALSHPRLSTSSHNGTDDDAILDVVRYESSLSNSNWPHFQEEKGVHFFEIAHAWSSSIN